MTLVNSAWAGPPFITDDPEPVKYQHWEVNYAVSKTWRQGSGAAGLPSVDINYGIFTDMQLHIINNEDNEMTVPGAVLRVACKF